jgi:acetyl esterase/lipase
VKRWPLFAVILALALMLAAAGVGVSRATTVTGIASGPTSSPPTVPSREIAALPEEGCGTVVFTPPTASTDHEADLCIPSGTPSASAIVVIHGGGGYGGSRSDSRQWARWYADRGHVVLNIDYTLVGDGTEAPVYPAAERDVKAGVQYLRRLAAPLRIDPEAIVLHGNSAGARLAAQVHVTSGGHWFDGPDLWTGVADHSNAMIGFYGFYDGTSLVPDEYYGAGPSSTDPDVRRRMDRADSVRQAGGATGPALLFHGDVDGVVDVTQTERFGRALSRAGASVTTEILVDQNHAFDVGPDDPFTAPGERSGSEIEAWLAAVLPPRAAG